MTNYEFTGGIKRDFHPEKKPTNWETFRNHRDIIASFTKRHAPPFAESLCVLGAGFCDDLDLESLEEVYRDITLVDISLSDMRTGLERQTKSDSDIKLVSCDLTGVGDLMLQYQNSPSDQLLEQILEALASHTPPELGQYDTVASTCLLSQLLCHATECLGESHSKYIDVIKAVRKQHIQLMVDLVNPGGCGMLYTDFVSSESLPELLTTNELKETARVAIENQNYLHGMNPGMISNEFTEPGIKEKIRSLKITDPWRWVVQDRIYACLAIIFDKVG